MLIIKILTTMLFFLMLFAPTEYQLIKVILLILLIFGLVISFFLTRGSNFKLSKKIFIWNLCLTTLGIIFIAYGYFNEAPGALKVSTVFFVWPWIFTFLVGFINEEAIKMLVKILIYSTFFVSIYALLHIFVAMNLLPDILAIDLGVGQKIGIHPGYVEYSASSLGVLGFTFPMLIVLNVFYKEINYVSVFWLRITIILAFMTVILANRRAIVLASIITLVIFPVFLFIFNFGRQKMINWLTKNSIFIFGSTALIVIINNKKILEFFYEFRKIFDFFNPYAEQYVRGEQFLLLTKEWLKYPLFGKGLGATVDNYLRDNNQPWSYELQYSALLFQVGLIGFLIIIILFSWLFYQLKKIINNKKSVSYLAMSMMLGFVGFLIINISNPYLLKYDFMWTIYIIVAIININLCNEHNIYTD